jgi:hypothetical protein
MSKFEPDFEDDLGYLDNQNGAPVTPKRDWRVGDWCVQIHGVKPARITTINGARAILRYERGTMTSAQLDNLRLPGDPDHAPSYCPNRVNWCASDHELYRDKGTIRCTCGWTTNDIKLPETRNHGAEGAKPMTNLFKYKDGADELFVTKLATDSAGRVVVEVKGTGRVMAVNANELEEVLPYTVGIRFLSDAGKATSTTYHYFAKAGELAVGDLLLTADGKYARVVSVDTKSRRADVTFGGWKLNATKLSDPDGDL